MIFDWFNAHEAELFGKSIANVFLKKFPVTTGKLKNKTFAEQLEVIDKIYLQIDQFKLTNKLNIYKKAKLGNAFMDELKAAGHKTDFVDQITKGILKRL